MSTCVYQEGKRQNTYMSISYTTITSKGQITLPAEPRRALGLRAGQKLAVRVEGDHLVIDPPRDLESVRAQLRAAAENAGTRNMIPHSGDGWAAHAKLV